MNHRVTHFTATSQNINNCEHSHAHAHAHSHRSETYVQVLQTTNAHPIKTQPTIGYAFFDTVNEVQYTYPQLT